MRKLFLKNAVLFMVVILTFTGLAFGQTHFEPVANQGQTAFPIFVTDATIDLVPLLPGDEIGVFDSDLCVGASVVTVLIDEENPLGIVTLQADPGNGFPGFTAGHLILFKVWSDLGGFEVSATPTSRHFRFSQNALWRLIPLVRQSWMSEGMRSISVKFLRIPLLPKPCAFSTMVRRI